MRLVTVKMPETYIEGLDELVRIGRYSSRSEIIRIAVRDLLKRELWMRDEELDGYPAHTGSIHSRRIPIRV